MNHTAIFHDTHAEFLGSYPW